MMKFRSIFFAAVISVLTLSLIAVAQDAPAGRGGGGMRGAAPGGRGVTGMGMRGAAPGGRGITGMGGRGMMPTAVQRPNKADRLDALEELQKQIAILKESIKKAPAKDPNISSLQGDALTEFTTQYTEESNAINSIATTLNTMRPVAGAAGGRGGFGSRGGTGGGLTIEVVTELIKLARQDNAPKLIARLEALSEQIEEQSALEKREIVPGVFQLISYTGGVPVNMYVVIGTEKALLVDTGYPGDISPADVEAITKLPYMVVNTHAHPDHNGSNNAFKQIYISEPDLEATRRASGDAEIIPIKDGYVFDLGGGKKLEVILVPGHSLGCICLLDAQDKVLITGDTANPNLLLNFTNVSMEAFKKSMERLLDYKDQYNLSLAGHGGPFPVSYITDTIACAQEIIDGKAQQAAQPAAGGATGGRGGGMRGGSATHTYGNIRITYNPNNIRENNN